MFKRLLSVCVLPGVSGSAGPVRCRPEGPPERGRHAQEDGSHDPAVEDHEQQTVRSALPEQF